jgi:RNA polymerase sigma-70 factor, ECF subfamily
MADAPSPDVTQLLLAWRAGDAKALERLLPLVYAELHDLAHARMRDEWVGRTIQTTALVHEAYIRLVDGASVPWQNRAHFFAVCARLMRRILVDRARARNAERRGGAMQHVSFEDERKGTPAPDVDLLALDEALTRLATHDPRKSKVVELRYFGGLSIDETAAALGVSPETVQRDWKVARLWLLRKLRTGPTEVPR